MINLIMKHFVSLIEKVNNVLLLQLQVQIKGTYTWTNKELELEFLRFLRAWSTRLRTFLRLNFLKINTHSPNIFVSWLLQSIIATVLTILLRLKHSIAEHTMHGNKLDSGIGNVKSYLIFRYSLLKFSWPNLDLVHNINDTWGLNLLTRLRHDPSHLSEHIFRHNFGNFVNSLCTCILEVESINCFSCMAVIMQLLVRPS